MMAAVWAALQAAALLFALPGSSSSPFCPEPCSCQRVSLLNCSLSGLASVPQLIPDSFSELDFSHNYLSSVKPHQPHHNLRKLWLGNNTISHLSLCVKRNVKSWHRSRTGSKRVCQAWAPTLQTLSVERNQLERLPEGLGGIPSLRVLWLAFNKISVLQPGELSDLRQLEELQLQHNLITHLHPQMFQDLIQLRVLDLRFNLLTNLHPLMYLTLRNIGAHVGLHGNRWTCDCNMRSLRRRMAYDKAQGLEVWNMMCFSPSKLLGTDLLLLKEEDLQCLSPQNSPDLHQDVTVYSGSQILLSCSAQDSLWWTPGVPAPVMHEDGGLLITDVSEKNTGLYVCVSEGQQVISIFNVQISHIESATKTRGLPRVRREITPQSRAGTTQSNLALAVCLSVIITFLVAFILGVLTRPYVDLLWKRITSKNGSSASNSVSSVEQRHYDNAAFSDSDEAVVGGPYRERRVTFRNEDDTANGNVQYYDTVANSDQNSVASDEVFAPEEGPNTRDSECELSMQQRNAAVGQNYASAETATMQIHQVEFERIPEPDELENKSLSSSSDSSSSENVDKEKKRSHTTPKSPLLEKETIHERANSPAAKEVQDPQVSLEFPGFSSEPFADWSPHSNKSNSKDDEELFEFSDSPRSTPARSNSGFAHTLDKQKSGNTSSSSSSDSGEEPTQDILHPKQGGRGSKIKSSSPKQSRHTSSSDESPDQETKRTKSHKLRIKWPSIAIGKKEAKAPSPVFGMTSSSDSENEKEEHTETKKLGTLDMRPIIHQESVTGRNRPEGYLPSLGSTSSSSSDNIDKTTSLKKTDKPNFCTSTSPRVKAPPQSSSSSSSSASEDEIKVQIRPHEQNKIQTSTPQRIKDQSGSSSSSSSESEGDNESHRVDQRPGSVKTGQLPIQEPKHEDLHGRWPTVDLLHVPHINRRLDFKVPLSHSASSSSSDNFDKTTSLKKTDKPTFYTSTSPRIKTPSQSSSSSSSSESEDDNESHRVNQRPGSVKTGQLPFQEPKPKDPHGRWPTVDLLHVPHINRRLDFKVPLSHSASSSSSDNIDKTTGLKKTDKPTFHTSTSPHVKAPSQSSSSSSSSESDDEIKVQIRPHEQNKIQTSTPQQIKDASRSSSSSSSESEDDSRSHRVNQRPGSVKTGQLPIQEPKLMNPHGRWPTVDLQNVPHINRRLDFKVPSLGSTSSSSSDNFDKTKTMKKTDKPTFHTSTSPRVKAPSQSSSSSSSSASEDEIKVQIRPHEQNKIQTSTPQRIKDQSGSSSSSSSESEDDNESHRVNQRPGSVKTGQLPFQEPKHKDPHGRWPTVDLLHVPHINRRLDFKVPLSHSASSSSSDNFDKTKTMKKTDKPTFHRSTSPHIKAPSQSSSSSSSSESEDEIKVQIRPHEQNKIQTSTPQWIKDQSGSSSSSSSESEDDSRSHRVNQRPGSVKTGQLPFQEPKHKDPHGRWPTVDLQHVPHINRRLDFKVPSLGSTSSTSSDNIDKTTGLKKTDKPTFYTSTSPRVKTPSQSSSSSSSSASEDEIKVQIRPHEQNKIQTSTPQRIKDQLGSSSSSSSESEDDNESHRVNQRPGSVKTGQLPFQEPKHKDPHGRWPTVDLLHVPHINRRLDFKVPLSHSASSSSSDNIDKTTGLKKTDKPTFYTSTSPCVKAPSQSSSSSSSSESEDDNKSHRVNQRPGSVKTGQLPIQEPKLMNPHGRWPTVDLLHVPHINRRLDFKVPLSHSASSSSRDNVDKTTGLKKTDKPTFHTSTSPHVKAPSQSSSSSSSSESDDEIKVQIRPHEQNKIQTSTPQQIKDASRSSSSSSSESEDDSRSHRVNQRPGSVKTGQLPIQEPKLMNPHGRWPTVDLQNVPHINRRLDFKVPSLGSTSSTSSDNFDKTKTMKKTDKPTFHTSTSPRVKAPSQSSSSSSSSASEDEIKVQIRPHEQNKIQTSTPQRIKDQSGSSSSSSSESEDDNESHRVNQRPGSVKTGQLPFQEPKHKDPHGRWPTVDLLHVPHINRRLDFKVPLSHSASSSSSDNFDKTKTMKKTDKPTFHRSTSPHIKAPSQSSSSSSSESEDEIKVQIRPHKQNKIQTSTPQWIKDQSGSSSSSSSESEDDNESHRVNQRPGSVKTGQLPFQEPKHKDPHGRWPTVDLQHVPHINRRLDFKVPSLGSTSSTSSDNIDKTTGLKKTDKPTFYTSTSPRVKAPSQSSSSSSSSASEDEIKVQIRPHEQNKIQTSTPQRIKDQSGSSLSSSSESEDDNESHRVNQRPGSVKTGQLPFQEPKHKDPHGRWPTVDLQHVPHINRRLDFKVPSLGSTSSTSSDNIDKTTGLKKTDKPTFYTSTSPRVKAPSQSSSSSSSSESEDDNESHRVNQRPGSVKTGQLPFQEPKPKDPHGRWPTVDLLHVPHINRRLDFKVPLSHSASSSSRDNIDKTTGLKKTDKPTFHASTSPRVKAPSQSSSSSSSSESDNEIKAKIKPHETPPGSLFPKEEMKFTKKSLAMNIHYQRKNLPNIVLEKYVTIEDSIESQTTQDNVHTSPESNLDLHRRWATMNLGASHFRKYLEISSQTAPRPDLISPTPFSPSSESRSGIRARPMSHIGTQDITQTDTSSVLETKPNNIHTTVMNLDDKTSTAVQKRASEYNFQTEGKKSKSESYLADFGVGTSKKDQRSSSSTEEETIKFSFPDLSFGVPRIKRRLNIKVLSPKMSSSLSSSSENEGDSSSKQKNSKHGPNVLSLADNSAISYKRSIIKPFSLYNNSRSQNMDTTSTDIVTVAHEDTGMDRNVVTPKNLTHLPLPPIRQTGASLGIPSPFMNKETKRSLQQILPENPKSPPLESNTNKDDEILQDNTEPVTLGLEYSSPGSAKVSSSFTGNSEKSGMLSHETNEASKAVFEDRKEMRGFHALAAMSLARRKWDTDSDRDGSLSSDHHISKDRSHLLYSRNDTDRVLSESPSHSPSASENDKRVLGLLYGVPSYRSHGIRDIKPPEEAPPPVPSTPSSDN